MPPMILVDGKPAASLDVLDRGLAYGDGVFRTMRASDGCILHWQRHYAKLAHDCGRLDLPCPTDAALLNDIGQVLAQAPECVIKIVVTRGSGGHGYAIPSEVAPLRVIAAFPLPEAPKDQGIFGIRARWCRTPVSMQPTLAGIKHLNRLDSVLARKEWTDVEIAEGLMLDRDARVVQGTRTNVFILEGDRLTTPVLDTAGVAGMQRGRVLDCAAGLGLRCGEDRISPERLLAADQVYLTNSVIGMWWLSRLDTRLWDRQIATAALLARIARTNDD